VETTGLDPLTDRPRLIQLFLPDTAYLIDLFTVSAALLAPLFATPKCWIGHNVKFDIKFLMAAGLPMPAGVLLDPMLMSQAFYAGAPGGLRHRLEDVAPRELGIPLDKALQTSDWSGTLSCAQLDYAARDAAILWPLTDALMAKIEAAGLTRVAQIEGRCIPALAEIELTGMPVNVDVWRALTREAETRTDRITAEMAGLLNGHDQDLFGECAVNWGSPQQVLALLQARGHRIADTNATTLKLLGADDPLVPLLLDYREAETLVSSFGESWLTKVHPKTGRFHSDYFSVGSKAGRTSCREPNIQQAPRDLRYRQAICAPEGRVLVKADFSQIELRLAAMMAPDQTMLEAFRLGKDLHVVTAAAVMGIPEPEVTKAQRQIAKALNFGLIYGMGVARLRENSESNYGVVMTETEAGQHKTRFFHTYTGLRRWHRQTGARLTQEDTLETRTLAGRRRVQVRRYTDALNSPVQGSGADGLKLALGRLVQHHDEAPTARLVAEIHDEIVAECPAADAPATAAWLQRHMAAAMQELVGDRVPIMVDTHMGQTWAGSEA
jgi:DNA polymerase I-like protein with 3'-5' exonuclease and polymerase domains